MRYIAIFLGLIVCGESSAGLFGPGAKYEILRQNNHLLHSINDNSNYERGYRDRDALLADRQRSERNVDRQPIIIQVPAPKTPYIIPQNQGPVYDIPQNRGPVYDIPQNRGPVYQIPQNRGPVYDPPSNIGPIYTIPPVGSGNLTVPPVGGSQPSREPAGGGNGGLNIPPSTTSPPSGGLTVPPIGASSASYYVIYR